MKKQFKIFCLVLTALAFITLTSFTTQNKMELNKQSVSALAEKLGSKPEVLSAFLTDGTTPSEEVKTFTTSLSTVHVFSETDLQTRIKNETESKLSAAETIAIGKTYGAIDDRIKKAFGIEKNEGEKTIDYLVRASDEKIKASGKSDDKTVSDLKLQIAAKDKLLLEKDEAIEQSKTEYSGKINELTVNTKLETVINALDIDSKDAADLNSKREFLKWKLLQTFEPIVDNGVLKFKDKATGQIKNDAKLANPINEQTLIKEFAPSVVTLKETSQKRGLGFEAPLDSKTIGSSGMAKYATRQELTKHMTDSGIPLVGEKANEMFDAWDAAHQK